MKSVAGAFLLFANLLSPVLVFSVTDEEMTHFFPVIENPSDARLLAMGSAGIATVNDAAAATTNPAGLAKTKRSDVAFTFRGSHFAPRSRDALFSTNIYPSVLGNSVDVHQLNFLGGTLRIHRYVVAFSENEAERSMSTNFDAYVYRSSDATIATDRTIRNWNGSFATSFASKFFVGGTISFSHLQWKADSTYGTGFAPYTWSQFQTSIDDGSTATAFILGVQYDPSELFSFGAAYSKGATFHFEESIQGDHPPVGTQTLKVPNRWTMGAAYHPLRSLALVFDAAFVQRSSLNTEMTKGYRLFEDYQFKDSVELHLGGEVTHLQPSGNGILLQAGFYRRPFGVESQLEFYDPVSDLHTVRGFAYVENHFTFGAGFMLRRRFTFNVGFDIQRPVLPDSSFDSSNRSFLISAHQTF